MKMRGIFSSLTPSSGEEEKKMSFSKNRKSLSTSGLLILCWLLLYCSHSTKVWWWIGEGIDFLPHHFALGFGWKSHKLGASLCLSHSSLPFFLCEFSLLDNQTWEILWRFSLSRVLAFSLLLPLDWSIKKGKAGRS
jgi:hypothetical protein